MSLEKKINSDFIAAMKNKDEIRKQVLSFVRAEMKNLAIESGKRDSGLDDADVVNILKKHQKKLSDTASQAKDAGRQDLVLDAENELNIVSEYLPQMLSDNQIAELVDKVIAAAGATSIKDMGRVMKTVLSEAAGCADNKAVSEIVRSKLG